MEEEHFGEGVGRRWHTAAWVAEVKREGGTWEGQRLLNLKGGVKEIQHFGQVGMARGEQRSPEKIFCCCGGNWGPCCGWTR